MDAPLSVTLEYCLGAGLTASVYSAFADTERFAVKHMDLSRTASVGTNALIREYNILCHIHDANGENKQQSPEVVAAMKNALPPPSSFAPGLVRPLAYNVDSMALFPIGDPFDNSM